MDPSCHYFQTFAKKALNNNAACFSKGQPFGLFFFLVTTHFLPMSCSFRASSLIRWRLLLLKRKGLVVLLNLASKVLKSASLEVLHWDLVMGAIAAPPFPGSSSSSSVSLLEVDKKHTRERNHPIDNNNNCCHRPLSAHTHTHTPIIPSPLSQLSNFPQPTRHANPEYTSQIHIVSITKLPNCTTLSNPMCFERLHICAFQNQILDLKLASQHACIPGTTWWTSNSTSPYKQKKHVLQEKNNFNCKRLEKTFQVCFLLDRDSNLSQFQQQDSTHNENRKKQPKKHKKNFGHQRKQTLEAIALDT